MPIQLKIFFCLLQGRHDHPGTSPRLLEPGQGLDFYLTYEMY